VKILVGDGRRLTAYEVRPVYLVEALPGGPPSKFHGTRVLRDAEAREELRAIVSAADDIGSALYRWKKL
jgi:hypothetical protein